MFWWKKPVLSSTQLRVALEHGLDLPGGALVSEQMRGNKGRPVRAGDVSSIITRAD